MLELLRQGRLADAVDRFDELNSKKMLKSLHCNPFVEFLSCCASFQYKRLVFWKNIRVIMDKSESKQKDQALPIV